MRPIGNVCYDLQQRLHTSIDLYTRGRAITNDWRISMARAIVRSIVTAGDRWYDQSIVASCDRSYEQSWHPVTDRIRALVASCTCDRAYDKSWHPNTDGTINRQVQRSIARSIVASCDRSYGQSLRPTTDRTINRGTKRFGIAA